MKSKIIILFFLLTSITIGYGQKIKVTSGNLAPLKGEKSFNLQYDYTGIRVGDKREADYIKEKVKKYNVDERGKGDKWKEEWFANRPNKFQPKFEELFNKYFGDEGMNTKEGNTEAKYTIKVKTTMIEPGYNIGVMRKPPSLEADIEIFETANPGKIVSKLRITKVIGKTSSISGVKFDFDSGTRISETYEKLGKSLAKYIRKKIK